MEKYTPMMMQYLKIKNKYPDTLILFRLGDFYELFFDDAKIASRELQLALTGKSAGRLPRARILRTYSLLPERCCERQPVPTQHRGGLRSMVDGMD